MSQLLDTRLYRSKQVSFSDFPLIHEQGLKQQRSTLRVLREEQLMTRENPSFNFRGTLECGWNIFNREGYSNDPEDISVNRTYLDHLAEAGLNWSIVFWTNASGFNDAWNQAVEYAHSNDIKLARAVYGFSGGGPEHTMAEPDVPVHLLRPSARGEHTALCPYDDETREWMAGILSERLAPGLDGIDIEPAREIRRNCICEQCQALEGYEWDVFVINFMADRIQILSPACEVLLHLKMAPEGPGKRRMSTTLQGLRPHIRHIFAWGADDELSVTDWLDADPRFEPFTKLARVLLFPEGINPTPSLEERVARTFSWCKLAADRGKSGHIFDYRIFGGTEWNGKNTPTTRSGDRLPASIALMGAAMADPYLDNQDQKALLSELRNNCDWDLDSPERFYLGETSRA